MYQSFHSVSKNSLRSRYLGRRQAYTLIEVLVVAVIVVLMLGMALPVFRAITGSRSEAGASNVIASMLGRARTDAIGLQQPVGVALLYNPGLQQSYIAEVSFPNIQAWTADALVHPFSVPPQGYVYAISGGLTYYYINKDINSAHTIGAAPPTTLSQSDAIPDANFYSVGGPPLDLVPDTDLVPLAAGVGVQSVSNCSFSGQLRSTDGYLSLGVILFDGKGRLTSKYYGISRASNLAVAAGLINHDYPVSAIGQTDKNGNITQYGVGSQFGLVLFQREAFVSQNFPIDDPAYTTANTNQQSAYSSGSPSPAQAESWLDVNASPLLIDRYTGTLIKSE